MSAEPEQVPNALTRPPRIRLLRHIGHFGLPFRKLYDRAPKSTSQTNEEEVPRKQAVVGSALESRQRETHILQADRDALYASLEQLRADYAELEAQYGSISTALSEEMLRNRRLSDELAQEKARNDDTLRRLRDERIRLEYDNETLRLELRRREDELKTEVATLEDEIRSVHLAREAAIREVKTTRKLARSLLLDLIKLEEHLERTQILLPQADRTITSISNESPDGRSHQFLPRFVVGSLDTFQPIATQAGHKWRWLRLPVRGLRGISVHIKLQSFSEATEDAAMLLAFIINDKDEPQPIADAAFRLRAGQRHVSFLPLSVGFETHHVIHVPFPANAKYFYCSVNRYRSKAPIRVIFERFTSGEASTAGTVAASSLVVPKHSTTSRNILVSAPDRESAPTPPLLTSFGSSPRVSLPRVLHILDEISELNWAQSLVLSRLERENYATQLADSDCDFLFLESCWKGNGASWEYAFTSPNLRHANAQALLDATKQAKRRNLPIVFWNKEDPMHYERFLPIAKHADLILTTDSNKVSDYRKDVPYATVDVLPFAASPLQCNPTDRTRQPAETVCFAGAYYAEGHDDRVRQMNFVLPAIVHFKGAIYDRYSHLNSDRYAFPEKFRPFIRPSVPFHEMVQLYKRFRVFLNVNTITDSPTMMSRRVYEILASGTPVVSAPSKALEKQFPGIVATGETDTEIREHVARLLDDNDHWLRVSHLGMREVVSKHTYAHRTEQLLRVLGHKMHRQTTLAPPLVSIILASRRRKNIPRMIENVSRQTYPNCEVIYAVTPDFTADDRLQLASVLNKSRNIKRAEVLVLGSDYTLGRCLNEAIRISKGEFIAKVDDDNLYFEHYISDLMLAFQFGDFDVVGKESHYCYLGGCNKLVLRFPDKRFRLTKFVAGDAMIMRRRVFLKTAFPERAVGEDTKLLRDIAGYGGKIYSADHFNFVKWRSADLTEHTWREAEERLLRNSVVIGRGFDPSRVRV